MTSTATSALTWGQTEIVDWLAINGYDLSRIIAIRDITPPDGVACAADAEAALHGIAERHAALRAKVWMPRLIPAYRLDATDRPTQFVDDEDGFVVRRYEDDAVTATQIMKLVCDGFDSGDTRLDPGRDPSQAVVYRRPDDRWGCLLFTSRVFTDGPGGRRLGAEFASLVSGTSAADLPASVDADTVVANEKSAARRDVSRRNIAGMRDILRQAPTEALVRPLGAAASATVIRSPAFAAQVDTISQRYGVPRGGVITALVSLGQWAEYGYDTVLLRALTQLPPPVRGASYVGPNALPALSAVPVGADWTIKDYFARAWAATIGSYRTCNYDPADFDHMQHQMAAEHGRELLDGITYLNYHSMQEIFDDEAGSDADDQTVVSHVTLDRHDRVFRTLIDIRDLGSSMTLHVEGAQTPCSGDTLRQAQTFLAMTAAVAAATDDTTRIGTTVR